LKTRSLVSFFTFVLLGSLVLTGCPPKKKLAIDQKPKEEVKEESAENADSKPLEPGEVEITQDWTEIPALQTIRFGYDSASLDEAARQILKANVSIVKKLPNTVTVRVEGHCDDRGTVEYNIALGQRRADAVRSYYATAGIGRARLESISYGEERPVCNFETDECWAQNRRGVTKVKNSQKIRVKPEDL
jgi:peptidoglycan-associated lipoprotein